MDMELPQLLSMLIFPLTLIVTIAAGCAAFSKRANLIGVGLLLMGSFGVVRWIFFTFIAEKLFESGKDDFAEVVITWFNPISSLVHLLAYVLVLAGIFKLSKPS